MGYLSDAMDRANQGQAPAARPAGNTLAGQTPSARDARPGPDADDPSGPALALDAEEDEAVTAAAAGAAGGSPASARAGANGMPAAPGETAAHRQDQVSLFDDRLVAAAAPDGVMAEEYRTLRTSLLARWQNRRHLAHTITSATPQEGKTITSLNLGLSFAELRTRRTLVIECDLRLPQFSKLLRLAETPGVVDVLQGKAGLEQVIHAVGDSRLHVIPAGSTCGNQAVQLLSSATMSDLLARLRQRYDHVIIDTPPVVELADAGILGALSDDVLLIVRMGRTPAPLVEQAVRILASYNAPVTSLVATDHRYAPGRYYGYGYRYGYGYGNRGRYHNYRKAG